MKSLVLWLIICLITYSCANIFMGWMAGSPKHTICKIQTNDKHIRVGERIFAKYLLSPQAPPRIEKIASPKRPNLTASGPRLRACLDIPTLAHPESLEGGERNNHFTSTGGCNTNKTNGIRRSGKIIINSKLKALLPSNGGMVSAGVSHSRDSSR